MSEKEEPQVEGYGHRPDEDGGAEPKAGDVIMECPVCGKERDPLPELAEGEKPPMPPSLLIIRFAGPGSAQITRMIGEGIVTPEQMGAAGQFLSCRAHQEWSMPLVQAVIRDTAEATIARFLEEMTKPRVETPPFFAPPRGGPPL